jgi:hypothetical protein
MLLYKYVGYDVGIKIIQDNTVGFRQPNLFNDPFELSASYPASKEENTINSLFDGIKIWAKKHIWGKNYGILSLTRSPLNPLMWAHYAEEHKGFVIGFNVSQKLFTSEDMNLIPVQFGSVIYTESKPTHEFLSEFKEAISIGTTYNFIYNHFEKLQRIFLHKPMCWSYEEEVRVVKCINGVKEGRKIVSGDFKIIQAQGSDLYILKLPVNSIKEIYLGIRNPKMEVVKKRNEFLDFIDTQHPEVKVHHCRAGDKTWGVESYLIVNN